MIAIFCTEFFYKVKQMGKKTKRCTFWSVWELHLSPAEWQSSKLTATPKQIILAEINAKLRKIILSK